MPWIVPHSTLSLFSYTTQDHLSRNSTILSELHPPTSVINQETAPQTHLWANLVVALFFSTEIPSSQKTLAWVKLTKKLTRLKTLTLIALKDEIS